MDDFEGGITDLTKSYSKANIFGQNLKGGGPLLAKVQSQMYYVYFQVM